MGIGLPIFDDAQIKGDAQRRHLRGKRSAERLRLIRQRRGTVEFKPKTIAKPGIDQQGPRGIQIRLGPASICVTDMQAAERAVQRLAMPVQHILHQRPAIQRKVQGATQTWIPQGAMFGIQKINQHSRREVVLHIRPRCALLRQSVDHRRAACLPIRQPGQRVRLRDPANDLVSRSLQMRGIMGHRRDAVL